MDQDHDGERWEVQVSWLAIGDWGMCCDELEELASAMEAEAARLGGVSFILSLGDNFYPSGASSVDSDEFVMWRLKFLQYEHLQVPWKVVLGNHDYESNPQCQMEFTTAGKELNPGGVWQMGGPADLESDKTPTSCCYTFAFPEGSCKETSFHKSLEHTVLPAAESSALNRQRCVAQFIGFDTNAAQWGVRRRHFGIETLFTQQVKWLDQHLNETDEQHEDDGTWRILFGHHPMYTMGVGHGTEARYLRLESGLDFEPNLVAGRIDAYFAGHEHVMQAHESGPGNILHLVCGATVESYYYRGRDRQAKVDWEAQAKRGFATGEILQSSTRSMLRVRFVGIDGQQLGEWIRYKPLKQTS